MTVGSPNAEAVVVLNPIQSILIQELGKLRDEVVQLRHSVEGSEQSPAGLYEIFHQNAARPTEPTHLRMHVTAFLLTTENAAAATYELWVGTSRVWAERMPAGGLSVRREFDLTIEPGTNIEVRGGVAADVAMAAVEYTSEEDREEQGRASLSRDY